MTVGVVALAIILLVTLAFHERERRSWENERQLLLERIQRPERVFVKEEAEPQDPMETDGAALALVGGIIEGGED